MRVRIGKKWYQAQRWLKTGVEVTSDARTGTDTIANEIFTDADVSEIITESDWKKGRRYTNEN